MIKRGFQFLIVGCRNQTEKILYNHWTSFTHELSTSVLNPRLWSEWRWLKTWVCLQTSKRVMQKCDLSARLITTLDCWNRVLESTIKKQEKKDLQVKAVDYEPQSFCQKAKDQIMFFLFISSTKIFMTHIYQLQINSFTLCRSKNSPHASVTQIQTKDGLIGCMIKPSLHNLVR